MTNAQRAALNHSPNPCLAGGGGSATPTHTQSRRSNLTWSPEPGEGCKVLRSRYDPYSRDQPVVFGIEMEPETATPPEGTKHVSLWGRVSFVQHPKEGFYVDPGVLPPRESCRRVFFGQLPYFVTEMELNWFTMTFGGGHAVIDPERILKRLASGDRMPTGCIHAYAPPEAIQDMVEGMHKRILADDTGVWYAQSDEERAVLADYVASMRANRALRSPNMPYETVVVEEAKSRFTPSNPVWLRSPAPPPCTPPPYWSVPPPPPYAEVRVGAVAPPPPPQYGAPHPAYFAP